MDLRKSQITKNNQKCSTFESTFDSKESAQQDFSQSKPQKSENMSKVPINICSAQPIKAEFVKMENCDEGDLGSSENSKPHKPEIAAKDMIHDFKDILQKQSDPKTLSIKSDEPEQSSEHALEHHPNEHVPQVQNDDWSFFLETGMFSDVKIEMGSREFRVHKIFLAGKSPVFADMFKNDDDFPERHDNRIVPSEVEVEVFEQLLRYIYSGKVEELEQNAEPLLISADKYALFELKAQCEQFLISEISIETVVDLLVLANENSALSLKMKAFDFILNSDERLKIALKDKNPQLYIELLEYKDRNLVHSHSNQLTAQQHSHN